MGVSPHERPGTDLVGQADEVISRITELRLARDDYIIANHQSMMELLGADDNPAVTDLRVAMSALRRNGPYDGAGVRQTIDALEPFVRVFCKPESWTWEDRVAAETALTQIVDLFGLEDETRSPNTDRPHNVTDAHTLVCDAIDYHLGT